MPKLKSRPQTKFLLKNTNDNKISTLDYKLKEQEQELAEKQKQIIEHEKILDCAKVELSLISSEIDNVQRKLRHKKQALKKITLRTNGVVS